MHTFKTIKILDIYLDTENARHDVMSNQTSIMEYLISKENVKQLAKDIAKNGLSPIDLIAVIKNNGNYVVVEGNRRLCALTLLNDPNKYQPTASFFNSLAQSSNVVPDKIGCIVFERRQDADIWIERKHEGEQGGIGTKNWSPEGKQRHNAKNNKADDNALASSLIDYAIRTGILLELPETRILTTATRYLGNPFFRKTIGIISKRNDPDVTINASRQGFDIVLERFLNDLLENTIVNSRSKKVDQEHYAKLLSAEGITPSPQLNNTLLSDLNNINTPQGDNPNGEEPTPEESGGTGSNHNPDERPYIIGIDFKVNIRNTNLKRAFDELGNIVVQDKPLAVSLVCRTFLEFLYRMTYEKLLDGETREKTHVVIQKLVQKIEKDSSLTKVEKSGLKSLNKLASSEHNDLSPKALGLSAHNIHYPDPKQLKREWDNISHILKYMLKKI